MEKYTILIVLAAFIAASYFVAKENKKNKEKLDSKSN